MSSTAPCDVNTADICNWEPTTPKMEATINIFFSPNAVISFGISTAHGEDKSMIRPRGTVEIESYPFCMSSSDAEGI